MSRMYKNESDGYCGGLHHLDSFCPQIRARYSWLRGSLMFSKAPSRGLGQAEPNILYQSWNSAVLWESLGQLLGAASWLTMRWCLGPSVLGALYDAWEVHSAGVCSPLNLHHRILNPFRSPESDSAMLSTMTYTRVGYCSGLKYAEFQHHTLQVLPVSPIPPLSPTSPTLVRHHDKLSSVDQACFLTNYFELGCYSSGSEGPLQGLEI